MLKIETYKPSSLVKGTSERSHVLVCLRYIADRLSRVDKEECHAVGKIPELAVFDCFFSSKEACLIFRTEECSVPVCIGAFGVKEDTLIGSKTGTPWVFITQHVARRHRIALARLSKQGVEQLMKHYNKLENCVYCKNVVAQRWLKWLGFTMTDRYIMSVAGQKFRYYYMEK